MGLLGLDAWSCHRHANLAHKSGTLRFLCAACAKAQHELHQPIDLPFGGVLVQETPTPGTKRGQLVELSAAALQALEGQSDVAHGSGGASPLDGSSCAASWVLVDDSEQ